jgi:hypothetical protein
MLRWLRRRHERDERSLVKTAAAFPDIDPIEELYRVWESPMRVILAVAILMARAGQAKKAEAYACNNRYYANSSSHVVHFPSCEREHPHPTTICRHGSVPSSEHSSGTCSHRHGVEHWE